MYKKVQGGKDQEKAQSEKDSDSKHRVEKKETNNQVLIPRKHIASRMSSYLPIRWPLSYLNLTKQPRQEKTGLRDFRPGLTKPGLYRHRKRLKALNLGFKKNTDRSIRVVKSNALISCAVTA